MTATPAPSHTPLILLTNDDGIEAPGLAALHEAISPLGRTVIVAPITERSAVGHAMTVFRQMPYRRIEHNGELWGHALDAMPADCVKLALTTILERRPNLVIAGINPGANLGNNIFYSGTVAAAREAAMQGIPALAVSIPHPARPGEPRYYAAAGAHARRMALMTLRHGLPSGVLLNINVPNLPVECIAGIAVSRQGRTMFIDSMCPWHHNDTILSYANVGDQIIPSPNDQPDSDDLVLARGMVSVTPLHFDMTHEAFRNELSERLAEEMSEKEQ